MLTATHGLLEPDKNSPDGYLVEVPLPMEGYQLYQALAFYRDREEDPLSFCKKSAPDIEHPEQLTTLEWMHRLQCPVVIIGPHNKILNPAEIDQAPMPGEPIFVGYNGIHRYYGFVKEGTIKGRDLLDCLSSENRPLMVKRPYQKDRFPQSSNTTLSEAILFIVEKWGKYIQDEQKPIPNFDLALGVFMEPIREICSYHPERKQALNQWLYNFFCTTAGYPEKRRVLQEETLPREIQTLPFAIQRNDLTYLRILLGTETTQIIQLYTDSVKLAEETCLKKFTLDFIHRQQCILEETIKEYEASQNLKEFTEDTEKQVSNCKNVLMREATRFYKSFLEATNIEKNREDRLLVFINDRLSNAIEENAWDRPMPGRPFLSYREKLAEFERAVQKEYKEVRSGFIENRNQMRKALQNCLQALKRIYGENPRPYFSQEETQLALKILTRPFQTYKEARETLFEAVIQFLRLEQEAKSPLPRPEKRDEEACREAMKAFIQRQKQTSWNVRPETLMNYLHRPILMLGPNQRIENTQDMDRYEGEPIYLWSSGKGYKACFPKEIKMPDYEKMPVLQGKWTLRVEEDENPMDLVLMTIPDDGKKELPSFHILEERNKGLDITEFPILLRKGEKIFIYTFRGEEWGYIELIHFPKEAIPFPEEGAKTWMETKEKSVPPEIRVIVNRVHRSQREVFMECLSYLLVYEKQKHRLLSETHQDTVLYCLLKDAPSSWHDMLHDLKKSAATYHRPLPLFFREEKTFPTKVFEEKIKAPFCQQLNNQRALVIRESNSLLGSLLKSLFDIDTSLQRELVPYQERTLPQKLARELELVNQFRSNIKTLQEIRNGDRLMVANLLVSESLLQKEDQKLCKMFTPLFEMGRAYLRREHTPAITMDEVHYSFWALAHRCDSSVDPSRVLSLPMRLEQREVECVRLTQIVEEQRQEIERANQEADKRVDNKDKEARKQKEENEKLKRNHAQEMKEQEQKFATKYADQAQQHQTEMNTLRQEQAEKQKEIIAQLVDIHQM